MQFISKTIGEGGEDNMELCYANNPKSLFRKYAKLVTWFANTRLGRDYLSQNNFSIPKEKIGLFLPNGYITIKKMTKKRIDAQLVVTPRACYAPKLYPALQAIDLVSSWITHFDEAKELLAWYTGLRNKPLWASPAFNVAFSSPETYNPDPSPETTSTDGHAGYYNPGINASYATIRAIGGNYSGHTEHYEMMGFINSDIPSNTWCAMQRSFYLFDTSALPDSPTITGAVFSVYGRNAYDSAMALSMTVVQSTPASNTTIATTDFEGAVNNNTRQVTADITVAAWSTVGYNDFTLNATGIGNISRTGITKFGGKCSHDVDNSAPTWVANALSGSQGWFSDEGSNQPKLVVTYSFPTTTNYLKSYRNDRLSFGTP